MNIVYCVAYCIVFIVGLIGNSFVIAVVLRAPRMRTVTNYFIVNLAIADILVIVFCLPATLMSNIFVRKCEFKIFVMCCDGTLFLGTSFILGPKASLIGIQVHFSYYIFY